MKALSTRGRRGERGMALLLSMFALLILLALASALIFSSNSETIVNSNYRTSQQAYFEAKAGIEEARARLTAGDSLVTPSGLPGASNASGIIYITNPLNGETVAPWNPSNAYFDTELCHENYNHTTGALATTNPGALPACGSGNMPASSTHASWSTTTASTSPKTNTNGAMYYKWVRISSKINASADPGDSTTSGTSYYVDLTSLSSATKGYQVCWNGANEIISSTGCSGSNNPVYVLTALAVTPNGSRRMVREEIYSTPASTGPFEYALYATADQCQAINLSGGSATNAYNSSGGKTYGATENNTGGGIASQGNILLSGGVSIGGTLTTPDNSASGSASCSMSGSKPNYGVSSSGGSTCSAAGSCVPCNSTSPPGTSACTQALTSQAPAAPAIPTISYSGTSQSYSTSGMTLSPSNYSSANAPNLTLSGGGTYTFGAAASGSTVYNIYNLNISGGCAVTLAPGTYNVNSLNLSGGSTLNISNGASSACLLNSACGGAEPCAACQVTINVQGCSSGSGSACSQMSSPINLSGGSVSNNTQIADNLIVNYGAANSNNNAVTVSGGSGAYFAVDAPNAPINISGGTDIFGALVGSTVNDSGGTNVHYDEALGSIGGSSSASTTGVVAREAMY